MKDDIKSNKKQVKVSDKPAAKPGFFKEAFSLAKQAVLVLGGLLIAGLGAYAVTKGLQADTDLKQWAFTVSGFCAIIDGLYVFVKGLKS